MMLLRSTLALSRRRLSIGRVPRQASTPQIFSSACRGREFSSVPSRNASNKSTESGKALPKVLLGGAVVGACFYAAYSRGYLNDIIGQKQQSYDSSKVGNSGIEKLPKGDGDLHDFQNLKEPSVLHTSEESGTLSSHVKDALESTGSHSSHSAMESEGDSGKFEDESDLSAKTSSNPKDAFTHVTEEDLPNVSGDVPTNGEQLSKFSSEETAQNKNPSSQEDTADMKSSGQTGHVEQVGEILPAITDVGAAGQGNSTAMDEFDKLKLQNEQPKETISSEQGPSASLLDTYYLEDRANDGASTISGDINRKKSPMQETSHGALRDASVSEDGKLILDFLQAIHAAEQRQAELDARVFSEEKKAMKEKYDKELKDARARELMFAEEAAMLEKEVKKERAKAAVALKSLQERAEERLKMELEEKEREADSKLKEVQGLAKAELAASIAREKAAQIETMAEANLNINALCMAFYARSEEARQTDSIQKLALGALALEDALSNGLPVQAELDALHLYIANVDKDSLLQLALSSVPEDVRLHGSDTPLQLNRKFDALKGKLRHFSLIPPNGGGILSHSLAHVASFLKVKEADQSGDGIESVLNRVESLLAQGKLVEAADVLEDGVKGSKATEIVGDWVRRARDRAITEQALVILQSYAASFSLT